MSHHNLSDRPYDDQNVIEDCEYGWRRFCCEILGRAYHMIGALSERHRSISADSLRTMSRKNVEILRRQVAAYRWVFDGTGGLFSFSWACEMCGRDPDVVREKIVAAHRPHRDIKYVVKIVVEYGEKYSARRPHKHQGAGRMATSLADSVAAFRRQRYGAACQPVGQAAAKAGGSNSVAG